MDGVRVLSVGWDATLAETRADVLSAIGFCVSHVSPRDRIHDLNVRRFAIAWVCHTLSDEQCHAWVSPLHLASPQIKVLRLSKWNMSLVDDSKADAWFCCAEGPASYKRRITSATTGRTLRSWPWRRFLRPAAARKCTLWPMRSITPAVTRCRLRGRSHRSSASAGKQKRGRSTPPSFCARGLVSQAERCPWRRKPTLCAPMGRRTPRRVGRKEMGHPASYPQADYCSSDLPTGTAARCLPKRVASTPAIMRAAPAHSPGDMRSCAKLMPMASATTGFT